ncbi:MAG: Plug domain-containing protein, partial [Gimesia chilikensis]
MQDKKQEVDFRLCGNIALATLVFPLTTAAQEAVLEEVLVTAEKRGAATVMDTSFSISAVSGATIEMQGLTRPSDFVSQVPGVSPASGNENITTIQIRGVS